MIGVIRTKDLKVKKKKIKKHQFKQGFIGLFIFETQNVLMDTQSESLRVS